MELSLVFGNGVPGIEIGFLSAHDERQYYPDKHYAYEDFGGSRGGIVHLSTYRDATLSILLCGDYKLLNPRGVPLTPGQFPLVIPPDWALSVPDRAHGFRNGCAITAQDWHTKRCRGELSMSSKRFLSIALAGIFAGTVTQAMAGTHSMLDPYASVEPPKPPKKRAVKPAASQAAEQGPQTSTTYVTMPMHEDNKKAEKPAAAGGGDSSGGIMGGVKDIGSSCSRTVKAAGSGIVNSTKAAGSKIAAGGKFVTGGIASGTKKIGGGIANGAHKSGEFLAKGAKAIGSGFKTTGEKMKDGTQAMGSKVASLPKIFKKDKSGELKVRQSAIASKSEPGNLEPSPQVQSQTQTQTVKVSPVTIPQKRAQMNQPLVATQGGNAVQKEGTISKFGKAFGKLNPFKKGEAVRATAANPNGAVPQ